MLNVEEQERIEGKVVLVPEPEKSNKSSCTMLCSRSTATPSNIKRKRRNSSLITMSTDRLLSLDVSQLKSTPKKSSHFKRMKRSCNEDSNSFHNETWQYNPSRQQESNIFIPLLKGSPRVTFLKENQRLEKKTLQELIDDIGEI